MSKMGQHWFHDLEKGAEMTWTVGNLLPVTPMYDVTTKQINGIFLSSPACQNDKDSGAWDSPPGFCALPSFGMCQNFCNKECSIDVLSDTPWVKPVETWRYATLHVMFKSPSDVDKIKCPQEMNLNVLGWVMGRSCKGDGIVPSGKE